MGKRLEPLSEFISRRDPKIWVFVSSEQESLDVIRPCQYRLTFTSVSMLLDLNTIRFSNEAQSMQLNAVMRVEIDENLYGQASAIRIRCIDKTVYEGYTEYIFLVK